MDVADIAGVPVVEEMLAVSLDALQNRSIYSMSIGESTLRT